MTVGNEPYPPDPDQTFLVDDHVELLDGCWYPGRVVAVNMSAQPPTYRVRLAGVTGHPREVTAARLRFQLSPWAE